MQLAVCGRTELRCSVPVLLLIPAAVVFGKVRTLAVCMISLSLHELSHALMARRLGFPAEALKIQPFGFVARLSRSPNTPSEAAAIAAAGPVMSLLLALLSAGMIRITASFAGFQAEFFDLNRRVLSEFSLFNLSLGAVNLLPVLPLDGGRLVLSFLEQRGKNARQSVRILSGCGTAFGILTAACGVYLVLSGGFSPRYLSFALTGAFIVFAALSELRSPSASAVRARLSSAARLASGGAVRVLPVAISERAAVSDALRSLSANGYGIVFVTDAQHRTVGILDEAQLMDAALSGNQSEPISALLMETKAAPGVLRSEAPQAAGILFSNTVDRHSEPGGDYDQDYR